MLNSLTTTPVIVKHKHAGRIESPQNEFTGRKISQSFYGDHQSVQVSTCAEDASSRCSKTVGQQQGGSTFLAGYNAAGIASAFGVLATKGSSNKKASSENFSIWMPQQSMAKVSIGYSTKRSNIFIADRVNRTLIRNDEFSEPTPDHATRAPKTSSTMPDVHVSARSVRSESLFAAKNNQITQPSPALAVLEPEHDESQPKVLRYGMRTQSDSRPSSQLVAARKPHVVSGNISPRKKAFAAPTDKSKTYPQKQILSPRSPESETAWPPPRSLSSASVFSPSDEHATSGNVSPRKRAFIVRSSQLVVASKSSDLSAEQPTLFHTSSNVSPAISPDESAINLGAWGPGKRSVLNSRKPSPRPSRCLSSPGSYQSIASKLPDTERKSVSQNSAIAAPPPFFVTQSSFQADFDESGTINTKVSEERPASVQIVERSHHDDEQAIPARPNQPSWRKMQSVYATKAGISIKDLMDVFSPHPPSKCSELEEKLEEYRVNKSLFSKLAEKVDNKLKHSIRHNVKFVSSCKNIDDCQRKSQLQKEHQEQIKKGREERIALRHKQLEQDMLRWDERKIKLQQKTLLRNRQKEGLEKLIAVGISSFVLLKSLQKKRYTALCSESAKVIQRYWRALLIRLTWRRLARAAPLIKKYLFYFRLRYIRKCKKKEEDHKRICAGIIVKFMEDFQNSAMVRPVRYFMARVIKCQRLCRQWKIISKFRIMLLCEVFDSQAERLRRLRCKAQLRKHENMKNQDIKAIHDQLKQVNFELRKSVSREKREMLKKKRTELEGSLKLVRKVYDEAGLVLTTSLNVINIKVKKELCWQLLQHLRAQLDARRQMELKLKMKLQNLKEGKPHDSHITIDDIRNFLLHDEEEALASHQLEDLDDDSSDKIKDKNHKATGLLVFSKLSKDAMCLLVILGERITFCQQMDDGTGLVRFGLIKKAFIKYAPPFFCEEDSLNELYRILPSSYNVADDNQLVNYEMLLNICRRKIWNVLLDGGKERETLFRPKSECFIDNDHEPINL